MQGVPRARGRDLITCRFAADLFDTNAVGAEDAEANAPVIKLVLLSCLLPPTLAACRLGAVQT